MQQEQQFMKPEPDVKPLDNPRPTGPVPVDEVYRVTRWRGDAKLALPLPGYALARAGAVGEAGLGHSGELVHLEQRRVRLVQRKGLPAAPGQREVEAWPVEVDRVCPAGIGETRDNGLVCGDTDAVEEFSLG